MGAALCFKQWPLYLLPVFWVTAGDGRAGRAFLGAALAMPLLALAPYAASEGVVALWDHLSYTGVFNVSLGQALLTLLDPDRVPASAWILNAWKDLMLLLLAGYWLSAWRGLKSGLPPSLALLTLAFLALAPTLSSQYLLWPLPFLALAAPKGVWRYSMVAGLYLLLYQALYIPGSLDRNWNPPALPAAWPWCWIAINLALWSYTVWEWNRCSRTMAISPHYA
jgi:hypothetical protein